MTSCGLWYSVNLDPTAPTIANAASELGASSAACGKATAPLRVVPQGFLGSRRRRGSRLPHPAVTAPPSPLSRKPKVEPFAAGTGTGEQSACATITNSSIVDVGDVYGLRLTALDDLQASGVRSERAKPGRWTCVAAPPTVTTAQPKATTRARQGRGD